MTPERHARVKELLLEAAERPASDRQALLAEACGDDEDLRSEVESLLRYHDTPATPVRDLADGIRGGDALPDRIGHFRLLQKLGEGGMGVVYEAEQERPVRRRVALKLVKWGMDSKEVLARFESERQALALMAHPNIAQVFDVGTTPTGRPYFAMEFVHGAPINAYCDANSLPTTERLQLFVEVCRGVEHAHQRGVIHRDLKPSNVLVSVEGGGPVPKIIDFGVAKATAQRLTERSVFTELGQWIGTPEYMSPEQAEISPLGVDTRTDVYSLGVMLYELITGALPFDAQELRSADFDEMRRRIREQEPLRPSTRVSRLAATGRDSAGRRRTDSRSLVRLLKGDLDWITMRALEKDRTRRYGSPSELAADVERFLAHEPVVAGPPSSLYRLRKFVRRHRLGVAAALIVLLALVAGVAGTTFGLVRAEHEARAARQVTAVLEEMLGGLTPSTGMGSALTPRRMVDRGVGGIRRRLSDQPVAEARLLSTAAAVYQSLAANAEARSLLEEARSLLERELGNEHPEVGRTMERLAWVVNATGDAAEARGIAERAVAILDKAGPEHEIDLARALSAEAVLTAASGSGERAWPLFERAARIQERRQGPASLELANTLSLEGLALSWLSYLDAARDKLEKAQSIFEETTDRDHPALAQVRIHLARVLRQLGEEERAAEMAQEAVRTVEKSLGPDQPFTAVAYWELANCLDAVGEREPVEPLFDRALAIQTRILGPDHPEISHTLFFKGLFLRQSGRAREALPLFERCLTLRQAAFGSHSVWVAWAHWALGTTYASLGDGTKAQQQLERAAEVMEQVTGRESPAYQLMLGSLGQALVGQGRREEGLAHLKRAVEIAERAQGPQSRAAAVSLNRLGVTLNAAGQHRAALEVFRRILDSAPPGDPRLKSIREAADYNVACTLALMGDRERAIAVLRRLGDAGFSDAIILTDPDLVSLSGDPDFDALRDSVRSRLRALQSRLAVPNVASPR